MKRYSINWENDEIVSIEIDGNSYDNPDDIPDPKDRAAVSSLIDKHFQETVEAEFGADFEKEFDKEFQQLGSETAHVYKIIAGIFLAVVLLAFTISIISTISIKRRLSREVSTTGQVVDLITRTGQDDVLFYYPVVVFELADGSQQTVQLTTGSSAPQYEYGEIVTILYDGERLENTRIDSNQSTMLVWLLPLITAILGIAFLVATIFVIWFARPDSNTAMPR